MKLKKLVAAGLFTVMLISSLAGCGNTETSQGDGQTTAVQSAQDDGKDTAGTEAAGKESADSAGDAQDTDNGASSKYNVTWDDTAEINLLMMCPATVPTGLPEVEAAINEITMAEIDTTVHMEMIEIGNYIQQVSLKMSSGEPVDLVLTFPAGAASFTSMQSQGQLKDITELLDEYAPEAKAGISDYLMATTVDNRVYALPINRDISTGLYLCMRTDVLEDLGLGEKAQNLSSYREFEEILAAVKASDKWSYLSGIGGSVNGAVVVNGNSFPGIDSFADDSVYNDSLGAAELLVADPTGKDTTVKIMAATDAYQATVAMGHEWYEKGYIYKDSATEKETTQQLVKSNKLFSYLSSGELGMSTSASTGCGMDMTCTKILTAPITTSSCTKFTWAVPNSSANPEAAVTFLNMMFTDARINNLMAWGIEGRDYVVEDGIAKYPEGVTEAPYHCADFVVGNQFLVYPWVGQDKDIREQAKAQMEEAEISRYLGFTCDTDAIQTELAAVNSVFTEFSPQIISGIAGPEVLDEFLEKLQKSGIDKIVDEYQRQLNAWLEAN